MSQFDPLSETLIRNWDQTMDDSIRIKLITTGHSQDAAFLKFTDQIMAITTRLIIEPEQDKKDLPGFLVKDNITCSLLPLERELAPFLDTLSQLSDRGPRLSQAVQTGLDNIDIPVRLTLYIALQCPHCPNVVKTVIPLAIQCNHIHLHIIDASLFPETAQKEAVLSVPCLVLDNGFRWTQNTTAEEILKMITTRDPSQLSSATLKSIIEQGDADWIARQMIEQQTIFDAFVDLLIHEEWSVRLGAMVIVEELAQADPNLAAQLIPILVNLFETKDIPIQGDILYALGETGTMETAGWIRTKVCSMEHPDLIDAARDAIDTLESKNK